MIRNSGLKDQIMPLGDPGYVTYSLGHSRPHQGGLVECMAAAIRGHVITLKFWANFYLLAGVHNFSEKKMHIFYFLKEPVTVPVPKSFKNPWQQSPTLLNQES